MNGKTFLRRLLLAKEAFLGRLDGVHELAAALKEAERVNGRLRATMLGIHQERQYWFGCWRTMGAEFEAAQESMCGEIDSLRRKLGIKSNKWEELMKKSFHDRHVNPPKHPIAGVKTDLTDVPCPPMPPAEKDR